MFIFMIMDTFYVAHLVCRTFVWRKKKFGGTVKSRARLLDLDLELLKVKILVSILLDAFFYS